MKKSRNFAVEKTNNYAVSNNRSLIRCQLMMKKALADLMCQALTSLDKK